MGQSLNPPLSQSKKDDWGFKHNRTGALLCPIDLDWSNTEYVLVFYLTTCYLVLIVLCKDQGKVEVGSHHCVWRSVAHRVVFWYL